MTAAGANPGGTRGVVRQQDSADGSVATTCQDGRSIGREGEMRIVGIALVFLLAACGDPQGPTGEPDTSQTVDVVMLGIGAPDSVLIRLDAANLRIDDETMPIAIDDVEYQLGTEEDVWSLFAFDLPNDAEVVGIDLEFNPEGFANHNGNTRAIDLSGPPLSMTMDAALIRANNGIVLGIDLERSLVFEDDQAYLLPKVFVRY